MKPTSPSPLHIVLIAALVAKLAQEPSPLCPGCGRERAPSASTRPQVLCAECRARASWARREPQTLRGS